MNKNSVTEKQLIGKIQELRQIKPGKGWASLAKTQILGEEKKLDVSLFIFNPAIAGLIAIFVLFGVFGFVQNSLPGDILYAVKKTFEKSQAVFVSENDQPAFQLKLANDRLEDLAKSPAKNLASTIDEFQANMSAAAKNLAKFDASTSDPVVMKRIVAEAKKLEVNKQKIESLGVVLDDKGTTEFNNAMANVVENLIQDLEARTLTEEKAEIVSQMKELFEAGKYSEALEYYLINQ